MFKQSSPQAAPDWAGLMAATLVAALPMLLLFIVFGRRIVNSIGFTGSGERHAMTRDPLSD